MIAFGNMAELMTGALCKDVPAAPEPVVRQMFRLVDLAARSEEALHLAEVLRKAKMLDAARLANERSKELTKQVQELDMQTRKESGQ